MEVGPPGFLVLEGLVLAGGVAVGARAAAAACSPSALGGERGDEGGERGDEADAGVWLRGL